MLGVKCSKHDKSISEWVCLEPTCDYKHYCRMCKPDHQKSHKTQFRDIEIKEFEKQISFTNLRNDYTKKIQKLKDSVGKLSAELGNILNTFSQSVKDNFANLEKNFMPGQAISNKINELQKYYTNGNFGKDNNSKKLLEYAKQYAMVKDELMEFEPTNDPHDLETKFKYRIKFLKEKLTDTKIKIEQDNFDNEEFYEKITFEENMNYDSSTLKNSYEEMMRESILNLNGPETSLNMHPVPLIPTNLPFNQDFLKSSSRTNNNFFDDYYVNRDFNNQEMNEIEDDEKIELVEHDPNTLESLSTLTLSGRGLDKSSIVCSSKEKDFIQSLFKGKNPSFTLIFRASMHKFDPLKFHEICDKRGPTVVIVKDTESIFGGYTDKSWVSTDKWSFKSSSTAFLFSYNKNAVYNLKSYFNCQAIICRKDSGPCFGKKELAICYEGEPDFNFSHVGKEYGTSVDFYSYTSLCKKTLFEVKEYEVFTVSFKE